MTYEEYRRELNEALEKADWMNPRDKNGNTRHYIKFVTHFFRSFK